MADPYPIRPITDDEHGAFRLVHDHAFNSGPGGTGRRGHALRREGSLRCAAEARTAGPWNGPPRTARLSSWPAPLLAAILGDMSGMKITPVSAMRARDVSRPRAEHLAAAAEREEAFTRQADKHAGRDAPGAVTPMPTPPKAVPPKAVPPKDNR